MATEVPAEPVAPAATPVAAAETPVVAETAEGKADEAKKEEKETEKLAEALAEVKVEHDPAAVDASASLVPGEVRSFRELPLSDSIFRGLEEECKFDAPFQIQRTKLPEILGEPPRSIIIQAPSGSGKTVCFVLGMLHRIDLSVQATQALCVVPTREIANQIWEMCMAPMSRHMEGFTSQVLVASKQRGPKSINAHVVIGTPATVANSMKRRTLNVSQLRVFVLDEADKMIDDKNGHRREALQITDRLPKDHPVQALLFSATFTEDVFDFARKVIFNVNGDASVVPLRVETRIPANVKQLKVNIERVASENQRSEFLKAIFRVLTVQQSIIFVQTRRTCKLVAKAMQDEGYSVDLLQGDLEHHERDDVVRRFRAGDFKVLVTTNVLARGVDFDGVSMVVNYDPPIRYEGSAHVPGEPAYEEYVHRVGRTGRAGRNGVAINFENCRMDHTLYRKLEERYGPREDGAPPMIEDVPVNIASNASPEEVASALEAFADSLEEIVDAHRSAAGTSV